jgi:RNA recognition motif-containing protein
MFRKKPAVEPRRSKEEGSMAKTLYVGNLSFQTEEEGLRAAFSEFGNVTDTRIVMDRDTGRSRGFGFVEMEDDQAAESAIERMNGADLDGRPLRVNRGTKAVGVEAAAVAAVEMAVAVADTAAVAEVSVTVVTVTSGRTEPNGAK